ncbi:MAG TPA: dCTP deaminase [Candidatus Thermoplasmatota archaeon]|nr:dCTP deaminase [Candidatus Thermoplasmatota archaeon]
MTVFSDTDILQALQAGTLGITPFEERNLTPNGYDLSIAEIMVPDVHGTETRFREGRVVIPGQARFLVSTREVVRMPKDVCAQLWIRSSYARRGVIGVFGKVEAGFEGTLTIGAFNAGAQPLEIPVGDRFCQIVFERLLSPPRALYAERSGNYQNQRGITLARDQPR